MRPPFHRLADVQGSRHYQCHAGAGSSSQCICQKAGVSQLANAAACVTPTDVRQYTGFSHDPHRVLHVEFPPVDQCRQAFRLQTSQVIREILLEVTCVAYIIMTTRRALPMLS